jgi:hypothetical protein
MSVLRLSAFVVPFLVVLNGCSPAESGDDTGEAEGAQSAGGIDILTRCPALEGADVSTVVVGDETTIVKQAYTLGGYTASDGTVQRSRQIVASAVPSTLYSVRFYRDSAGKSKFQLSIGTWAGMQSSIEGNAKKLVASGNVTFASPQDNYGELAITSRRDALRAVIGDASKFRVSNLDCSGESASMTLDIPIVTLEKTNNQTIEIRDTQGRTIKVTPTVKWKKNADSAPLRFDLTVG